MPHTSANRDRDYIRPFSCALMLICPSMTPSPLRLLLRRKMIVYRPPPELELPAPELLVPEPVEPLLPLLLFELPRLSVLLLSSVLELEPVPFWSELPCVPELLLPECFL